MAKKPVITAKEAAAMIPDGATIMCGGFLACGQARAIVKELVARGTKDLTLIANDMARAVGPKGEEFFGIAELIHNHQVKRVIATHVGMTPEVGQQNTEGTLEVNLLPQGTLAECIRAGGAGLGGVLTPVGVEDKIFDAFTRAENSVTNKIQGTGLGMAITKNLVEAMGGTIDVESELGQGSCFEVLLDLKIAEDRTVALAAQEETDEQDGNILQGMRFLCAEDNELNAEILTELLKIEGAECTICENGEEILKAFEQSAPGDYDMILMDVQMPVMNGYEATKAIRRSSHELAKKIPIIAMTANAFSEDIQHSLAAGMNAHISKPVEMKVLEKTIRSSKIRRGHRNAAH